MNKDNNRARHNKRKLTRTTDDDIINKETPETKHISQMKNDDINKQKHQTEQISQTLKKDVEVCLFHVFYLIIITITNFIDFRVNY